MTDETRRKFLIRSLGSAGALVPLVYGCDSGGSGGGPLGPTGVIIQVSPAVVNLARGSSQTFTASGGTGSYTWSISNSDLGTIDTSTGSFTAGNTNGTLSVIATDTIGTGGSGAVTIVSSTLVVSPSTLTVPGNVSLSFTQTYTGSGGGSSYTYNLSGSSGGYSGAIMDVSTGILTVSAVPSIAQGDQTLTITSTDENGDTGTATVTIETVIVTVSPAVITIPNTVTLSFTQTFTASGGTSPYTYNLTGMANNYSGATLDLSTGILTVSTIPTSSEGTQSLTITATDSLGNTGTSSVTIDSISMMVSPATLSVSNAVTTPYTQTFTVSGGTSAFTYALSGETGGYTGAAIAAATGILTVTTIPTALEGTQTLTVTATDSLGITATATVTVNSA